MVSDTTTDELGTVADFVNVRTWTSIHNMQDKSTSAVTMQIESKEYKPSLTLQEEKEKRHIQRLEKSSDHLPLAEAQTFCKQDSADQEVILSICTTILLLVTSENDG